MARTYQRQLGKIKTGDTLNIDSARPSCGAGHWPDNMKVTYSVRQDLFSNDAFGQHYASALALKTSPTCGVIGELLSTTQTSFFTYGRQADSTRTDWGRGLENIDNIVQLTALHSAIAGMSSPSTEGGLPASLKAPGCVRLPCGGLNR